MLPGIRPDFDRKTPLPSGWLFTTATEDSARLASPPLQSDRKIPDEIEALNETVEARCTPLWDSFASVSSDFVCARVRYVDTL